MPSDLYQVKDHGNLTDGSIFITELVELVQMIAYLFVYPLFCLWMILWNVYVPSFMREVLPGVWRCISGNKPKEIHLSSACITRK